MKRLALAGLLFIASGALLLVSLYGQAAIPDWLIGAGRATSAVAALVGIVVLIAQGRAGRPKRVAAGTSSSEAAPRRVT